MREGGGERGRRKRMRIMGGEEINCEGREREGEKGREKVIFKTASERAPYRETGVRHEMKARVAVETGGV